MIFIMILRTSKLDKTAGVAQLVEQLICNQQVGGSKPLASLLSCDIGDTYRNRTCPMEVLGSYPSGQREQTVNLLRSRFGGSNPSLPTTRA